MADALRGDILSGAIQPGAHLRQNDIAAKMGVSTTPVREAFVALRREGLVSADSHKGVVVLRPTVTDLVENYRIRVELEALATRHAVPNLDQAALDDLDKLLHQMRAANPRRYVQLNREFHLRIYRAAEMPRLLELVEGLRDASIAYLNMIAGDHMSQDDEIAHAEHVAILSACRRGQADKAGQLMASHLENMLAMIERKLPVVQGDEGVARGAA